MQFSLGSDPEFMLVDNEGQHHSAIDIVPGSKSEKLSLGNGHLAFWDNVLAECCPVPGKTKKEVIKSFQDCFQRYAKVVAPYLLKPQASQIYPAKACKHPGALEFGCEPEQNAYEYTTVLPPCCSKGNTFRSGGGHIHVGHVSGSEYPLLDYFGKFWVTRYMDFFVGLPSLVMDVDPTSQARRRLYGGAGNMRPKEYGIEYRTLSNFWLASPKLVSIIWDLTEFTLNFIQQNRNYEAIWNTHQQRVRKTINEGNTDEAPRLIKTIAEDCKMPGELVDTIFEPLGDLDFYSEWKIKI